MPVAGSVLTMEGEARLVPDEPGSSTNPAYQAKYGEWIAEYGWTTAWFEEHYPYAVRITPDPLARRLTRRHGTVVRRRAATTGPARSTGALQWGPVGSGIPRVPWPLVRRC